MSHLLTWRGGVWELFCSRPPGGLARVGRSHVGHLYFTRNGGLKLNTQIGEVSPCPQKRPGDEV